MSTLTTEPPLASFPIGKCILTGISCVSAELKSLESALTPEDKQKAGERPGFLKGHLQLLRQGYRSAPDESVGLVQASIELVSGIVDPIAEARKTRGPAGSDYDMATIERMQTSVARYHALLRYLKSYAAGKTTEKMIVPF